HSFRCCRRITRAGALCLALLPAGVVAARAQDSLRGRVVSTSDASPVPAARVLVGGTTQGTLTDDKGEYRLILPAGACTLVFLGNTTPLYVVDGMYVGENPNLDPDDIESMEVLKDASAAAQYGAQAANGVVVIRTRRGRGDTRVDLRSSYGFQAIPKRVPMMNTAGWAAVARQAYQNAGQAVIPGAANPPPISTDWQDAVFTTGAIQDHGLTVSGATANASYLISGGYLQQDGAIIQTGFHRYNFRINSQLQRGRLTLGENVALSSTRRQGLNGFPLIDVVRFPP